MECQNDAKINGSFVRGVTGQCAQSAHGFHTRLIRIPTMQRSLCAESYAVPAASLCPLCSHWHALGNNLPDSASPQH